MSLSCVEVDRFSVGGFGDLRLQKRGAWCHQALVAHPGSCILELGGGLRRGEIGFGRFLRNPAVTVQALSEAAGDRTGERVQGRDILAIQDTSEIVLGGQKMRQAGFGPVGRGGFLGGVLVHPVLAVDAISGELVGIADIAVWNRDKPIMTHHSKRPLAQKESQKWLNGARRAGVVLAKASRITVVSDRESDLYEDFACRPLKMNRRTAKANPKMRQILHSIRSQQVHIYLTTDRGQLN